MSPKLHKILFGAIVVIGSIAGALAKQNTFPALTPVLALLAAACGGVLVPGPNLLKGGAQQQPGGKSDQH